MAKQVLTKKHMEATARGHSDKDIYGEPVVFHTWEARQAHVKWCWEQAGLDYSEELHLRCLKAFRDPAWFIEKRRELKDTRAKVEEVPF